MDAEMSLGIGIVAAEIVSTMAVLVLFVAPRTGQPSIDKDGGN